MDKDKKKEIESKTRELKALVGSTFQARNELCGSRNQILYMVGDLVTIDSLDVRNQRVRMHNKDGFAMDAGFAISYELFQKDFSMTPCHADKPAAGTQEPAPAEEPQETYGMETADSTKPDRQQPMTVSQELFKQLIFDTVMESQDQMSKDVANALLDILNRYDIGEPWRSMEDRKPISGKYFFIKMKKSAGYTDPYWEQPLLAVRVKGGFHIAGSPFKDEEVEAYNEVRIPKKNN